MVGVSTLLMAFMMAVAMVTAESPTWNGTATSPAGTGLAWPRLLTKSKSKVTVWPSPLTVKVCPLRKAVPVRFPWTSSCPPVMGLPDVSTTQISWPPSSLAVLLPTIRTTSPGWAALRAALQGGADIIVRIGRRAQRAAGRGGGGLVDEEGIGHRGRREPVVVDAAGGAVHVAVQRLTVDAHQLVGGIGHEVQPQLVGSLRGAADAAVGHRGIVIAVAAGADADVIRAGRQVDLDVRIGAEVIVVAGDDVVVRVEERQIGIQQAGTRSAGHFGEPLGDRLGAEGAGRVDGELVEVHIEARRPVQRLERNNVGVAGEREIGGRRAGRVGAADRRCIAVGRRSGEVRRLVVVPHAQALQDVLPWSPGRRGRRRNRCHWSRSPRSGSP